MAALRGDPRQEAIAPPCADDRTVVPSDLMNLNDEEMAQLFEPTMFQNELFETYYQGVMAPGSLANESMESLIRDLDVLSQPDYNFPGLSNCSESDLQDGNDQVCLPDSTEFLESRCTTSPIESAISTSDQKSSLNSGEISSHSSLHEEVLGVPQEPCGNKISSEALKNSEIIPATEQDLMMNIKEPIGEKNEAVTVDSTVPMQSPSEMDHSYSISPFKPISSENSVKDGALLLSSEISNRVEGTVTKKKLKESESNDSSPEEDVVVTSNSPESSMNSPKADLVKVGPQEHEGLGQVSSKLSMGIEEILVQENIGKLDFPMTVSSVSNTTAFPEKCTQDALVSTACSTVLLEEPQPHMKQEDEISANTLECKTEIIKKFRCEVCNLYFVKLANLARHLSSHTLEPVHCCDHCDLVFRSSKHVLSHKVTLHSYSSEFVCSICDGKMGSHPELEEHEGGHLNIAPFQCAECNTKFKFFCEFCMHSFQHTREMLFKCQICCYLFRSEHDLIYHERFSHASAAKVNKERLSDKFQCEKCEQLFDSDQDLTQHTGKVHPQQSAFVCDMCEKEFCKLRGLKMHRFMVHVQPKKRPRSKKKSPAFKCVQCEKHFQTAAVYLRHLSSHRKTRRSNLKAKFQIKISSSSFKVNDFLCDLCFASFSQASDLRKHVIVAHTLAAPRTNVKKATKPLLIYTRKKAKLPSTGIENLSKSSSMLSTLKGLTNNVAKVMDGVVLSEEDLLMLTHPDQSSEHFCNQCQMYFNNFSELIEHKHLQSLPFCSCKCGESVLHDHTCIL